MEILAIIAIVLLAVFLNGLITEAEDNSPGGFNNPDGKWIDSFKKPTKIQIFIWLLGLLIIGAIIVSLMNVPI